MNLHNLIGLIFGFISAVLFPVIAVAQAAQYEPANSHIEQLPDGRQWLDYFKNSLLPFFNSADAIGDIPGDYPSWRCNDGTVYNPIKPCVELENSYRNREYIISKSRQTYLYGVAYHLTGDEAFLALAKDGVDYIRDNAIDKNTGSIATYLKDGLALPSTNQRTAQQLSYGILGLAFYYYLTRDNEVLEDIVRVKNYLFDHYYDSELDLFMWYPIKNDQGEPISTPANLRQWQRLAAQLDILNTHLLLLTPIVPEPLKTSWTKDLIKVSDILLNHFYDDDNTRFKFILNSLSAHEQTQNHLKPDFGKTIKSFWMIYFIARLTDNSDLIQWVKSRSAKVFEQAYVERTGSWGYRTIENGSVDENKLWWVYAELDQMAATLALKDTGYTKYLVKTYDYWFSNFVDNEDHGVWTWLKPNGEVNQSYPKMTYYKKGYHAAEHALIGYITSLQLKGQFVELYYAFDQDVDSSVLFPYYFKATVVNKSVTDMAENTVLKKIKVTFSDIH